MKNWKEQHPHEIRDAASKGNKGAQKELARRKQNMVGGLIPDWETRD